MAAMVPLMGLPPAIRAKADYEVLVYKAAAVCQLDVQTAQVRLESLCTLLSCLPDEALAAIMRGEAEYAYMQCGEWVPVTRRDACLPESFIFGAVERMPEPSPYERGYLDRYQDRRHGWKK